MQASNKVREGENIHNHEMKPNRRKYEEVANNGKQSEQKQDQTKRRNQKTVKLQFL